MSLTIVNPPSVEPVSLAEARAQARIDHALDDASLAAYIMAAREMCEHELQRTLIATTYDLTLDEFPSGAIELPMGSGTMSVTSITYTDTAGATQTVSAAGYVLTQDTGGAPQVVSLSGWPTAKATPNAVRVRYVSGDADASRIPAAIKAWILLHATHLYEQRGAAAQALEPLPFITRLLDPYRTYR